MTLVLEKVKWPYYCCPFLSGNCKIFTITYVWNGVVSRVYSVAGILCLQWMVYVALFPATSVLNFHITASRSVCSGQNNIDFFFWFLDVALSRFVAHIFSQWFSEGSFCSSYYWHHFYFYIPPLRFYCKVFAFQSIFGFYIDHISLYRNFEMTVSVNGHVLFF
jgi:hypothetical protein